MTKTDHRTFFLQHEQLRVCSNPECRRVFRAKSKFNPGQIYCGSAECSRTRNRQRQWKHSHPALAHRMGSGSSGLPPNDTVAGLELLVNRRLLWLVAGMLAAVLNIHTTDELQKILSGLISSGCRLCGRDGGISLLGRLFITEAEEEK